MTKREKALKKRRNIMRNNIPKHVQHVARIMGKPNADWKGLSAKL